MKNNITFLIQHISRCNFYSDSDNVFCLNDFTPTTIRSETAEICLNTLNSPRKWRWKTLQLPQFDIYQNEILTQNSNKLFGLNGLTLAMTGLETSKIWPYISVEISFQSEFHSISAISGPTKSPWQLLACLLSIALNSTRKAPKIPQK